MSPDQRLLLPPVPGSQMFSMSTRPNLGLQREDGANRKIQLISVCISLCSPLFLTLPKPHYPQLDQQTSDTRKLYKTFSSLICPPLPPSTTSLTADHFPNYFTNFHQHSILSFTHPGNHTKHTHTADHPLSSYRGRSF